MLNKGGEGEEKEADFDQHNTRRENKGLALSTKAWPIVPTRDNVIYHSENLFFFLIYFVFSSRESATLWNKPKKFRSDREDVLTFKKKSKIVKVSFFPASGNNNNLASLQLPLFCEEGHRFKVSRCLGVINWIQTDPRIVTNWICNRVETWKGTQR